MSVREILPELIDECNLPALGVVYDSGNGSEPFVAADGVRKIGIDINATTGDIWHFGSCTKAMTAAVVALLIQDDLLSWNSTLGTILGDVDGCREMLDVYRDVTIELLSSHTSGITDAALTRDVALELHTLNAAQGRIVATNVTLTSEPAGGAQKGVAKYANMNYVILGLMIEIVTSISAEGVVEQRLWGPLNMTSAGWGPNPETSTSSVDNPYPHTPSGTKGTHGEAIPLPESIPVESRDNPPALNTAGRAHMRLADFNNWLRLQVDSSAQAAIGLQSSSLPKLRAVTPGSGGFTYGGWIGSLQKDGRSILNIDGSNTLNYATAWINVGTGQTVAATTNVGGEPVQGATYLVGTHRLAEGLLDGSIVA